jgi:hypothetical protein
MTFVGHRDAAQPTARRWWLLFALRTILKASGQPIHEFDQIIDATRKQCARARSDLSAIKSGDHLTTIHLLKNRARRATLCWQMQAISPTCCSGCLDPAAGILTRRCR